MKLARWQIYIISIYVLALLCFVICWFFLRGVYLHNLFEDRYIEWAQFYLLIFTSVLSFRSVGDAWHREGRIQFFYVLLGLFCAVVAIEEISWGQRILGFETPGFFAHFNPLMYIDPITSILLPCVFLVMGGVPLPGGSVLINRAALRSRAWESAVAAAGPLANCLLFLLIAVLLHPATGLVDGSDADPPMWARLLGVLAVLQVFAVILNLIPVPPFDGF